jgi:hypothetical protein
MDRQIRRRQRENVLPNDCATSDYKRVIHDPHTWRFLQDTYIKSANEHSAGKYSAQRNKLPSYSGFTVAVEVKDHGPRGRSIYAAEPIAAGTKIWAPTHLVGFHTPRELYEFLGKLDHDLQCDVLLWAYVEKGEGHVSLALDPASFTNHGEKPELINMDENNHATRDIQMGEELLENYTKFIGFDEDTVEWFHKMRGIAWKEGGPPGRSHSTTEYNLLGAPKLWDATGLNGRSPGTVLIPLLALGLFGVSVLILKKVLPPNLFKKQKDGL